MRTINVRGRRSGDEDEVTWTVDGEPVPLGPSLAVRNHSPSGFEWGYAGSGPAQSALAILIVVFPPPKGGPCPDCGGDGMWQDPELLARPDGRDAPYHDCQRCQASGIVGDIDYDPQWPGGLAEKVYQQFKFDFIAGLDQHAQEVELVIDIDAWLAKQHVK